MDQATKSAVKLVVFDWNGTLLSDLKASVEGVSHELAVINRPPISTKIYQDTYDTPTKHFYKALGISENILAGKEVEMSEAFHKFYEPRTTKARTRHGTRYVLKHLKDAGINCIILSNHTVEGIYAQLARLKLNHYFSEVLANESISLNQHTGKEGRLKAYLAEHNFLPSQVAIVGDTVEEIRIGHNLGIKSIAITGGYNSTKRLKAARPDVLISALPDIIESIKEH